MTTRKILFILFCLFMSISSCNKKKQLADSIDPNTIHFLVSQPSISIAQFASMCTNNDITLDTVIFLNPDNAVFMDIIGKSFLKNEGFLTGHWEAVDGTWILQFKGRLQSNNATFSISVPYEMSLDGDSDEQ